MTGSPLAAQLGRPPAPTDPRALAILRMLSQRGQARDGENQQFRLDDRILRQLAGQYGGPGLPHDYTNQPAPVAAPTQGYGQSAYGTGLYGGS